MWNKPVSRSVARRIQTLMEHGSSVTGLRLSFHDLLQRSGLPLEWMLHTIGPCIRVKRQHERECSHYCGNTLHRVVSGLPRGLIEVCPFGMTQISLPVFCEGAYAGVLFAGVVWTGGGASPQEDLPEVPGAGWLKERQTVLAAIARELGELLRGEAAYCPADRRSKILQILQDRRDAPLTLAQLAAELGLSPSRTGHVVREVLGCTFPEALRRQRLQEAAHLLSSSDLPVGEISRLVGFDDPNYFSRLFTRTYELSPREYRRRYPSGA